MGMMIHRNRAEANKKAQSAPSSPITENTPVVEKKPEEEKTYTRKDIQFMKAEDLKALAEKLGIDAEQSGAKLKPLIIERLGL